MLFNNGYCKKHIYNIKLIIKGTRCQWLFANYDVYDVYFRSLFGARLSTSFLLLLRPIAITQLNRTEFNSNWCRDVLSHYDFYSFSLYANPHVIFYRWWLNIPSNRTFSCKVNNLFLIWRIVPNLKSKPLPSNRSWHWQIRMQPLIFYYSRGIKPTPAWTHITSNESRSRDPPLLPPSPRSCRHVNNYYLTTAMFLQINVNTINSFYFIDKSSDHF